MTKENPYIGSSLDDFLKEEGILEQARSIALKEALAWQVEQAMKKEKDHEDGNGPANANQPRSS